MKTFQSSGKTFLNEANQVVSKTAMEKYFPHARDIDMSGQLDPITFRFNYLRHMLFSKYAKIDVASSSARKAKCLDKYLACEAKCKTTNIYFKEKQYEGTKIHHLLMLTRKYINDILGPLTCDLFDRCTFGPGSSTRLPHPYVDAVFKLEGIPHCTSLLKDLLDRLNNPFKHVFPEYEIRECAKYTTVPKNAVIDRPIEIQPCLNMFLQKALGNMIRERMKGLFSGASRPLNLNDQTLNQELAKLGSMFGDLCTLDLSSASDLISTNFVSYLIDDTNWLAMLYASRVGIVELECGRQLPLEKFSAMGNGYTWELQSLIFYSMVRACNEYHGCNQFVASVYGDDIICHRDVADTLIEFLHACGLSVNTDKSFLDGPFRESCGKHYYNGYDVTPCYMRKPLVTNQDIIAFHNRLFHWATQDGFKDIRCLDALAHLVSHLSCEPLRVPVGKGDIGIHTCGNDLPESRWHLRKDGDPVALFRCYKVTRSKLTWPRIGALRKALLMGTMDESTASDVPFGIERSRIGKMPFTAIPTYGSWM